MECSKCLTTTYLNIDQIWFLVQDFTHLNRDKAHPSISFLTPCILSLIESPSTKNTSYPLT